MNRTETEWLHTLYMTHAEPLYRVAQYRLGDPDRARDLVQEVFAAAAQKVGQLQNHENPWAWLLRALNYELSHEFSRRARQAEQEIPLIDLTEASLSAPPAALSLAHALPSQLSPRDREILLLYYEENLSYREIAAQLNIPVATCSTWLKRARERCRKYWNESL